MSRKKLKNVGYDINKMNAELKKAAFDIGVEVLEELAERVAEEARRRAPKLEDEEKLYDVVDRDGCLAKKYKVSIKNRRGPDKKGGSDSGSIKDTITVVDSKKISLSKLVMSPAWYSHFVEFGTDPHSIFPKKGKKGMLFPVSESTAVFSKKAKHPGYKARKPFLRPAADMAEKFLEEIVAEYGLKK